MSKHLPRQEHPLHTPPRPTVGAEPKDSTAPTDSGATTALGDAAESTEPAPAAPQSESSSELSHDQIAVRAYEIWLSEGSVHGRDLDHWFEAIRQLQK